MSRISPGTILMAFMAILCGLLGIFFVTRPRPAQKAAAEPPKAMVVPVASASLQTGRRVTLGDIALLKLNRAELKKRGITGGFMASTKHIIGRVLKEPLKMGATFKTDAFFPEGTGPGITGSLRKGYRAVTVDVGGKDAVLGFATAGSWIDVIFRSGDYTDNQYQSNDARYRHTRYGDRGGMSTREITTTLLQRVRVLAVDSNTTSSTPDKTARTSGEFVSVTLEVTPQQAEKLRVVEGRGSLSLALRPDADDQVQTDPAQVTLDQILNFKNQTREMEVYQGTQLKRKVFHRQSSSWRSNGDENGRPVRTVEREPQTQTKTE